MLANLLLIALAGASAVFCAPAAPEVTDADVLQLALTLEHLENAFYASGLAKYSESDFEKAGFPFWVRGRFAQIGQHEADHVTFLSGALGSSATKPCQYNFPHTDPRSFAALSMILENVGGSAYIGAAQLLSNKDTLTAAASILAVESRHASWVSSAVLKEQGWNGAFDTPITPSGAFSLAAQFITSCPPTNPALPVTPFPALTLANSAPAPGAKVAVKVAGAKSADAKFVAWLSGLKTVYSDIATDGTTVVPPGLMGTVFAVVVSSKDQPPSQATLRSGLAEVQFPFNSFAREAAA
ncbi:ferritin-like domain-containing protein [Daedaleopsis nitida]|nr:ferritin-like domain-containing protein [Daedaleopsis nitida]